MGEPSNQNTKTSQDTASWDAIFNYEDEISGNKPPENKDPEKNTHESAAKPQMEAIRRWAFENAISETDYPKNKLQELIGKNKLRINEQITRLNDNHTALKTSIESNIMQAREAIENKKTQKTDVTKELADLKQQKETILKEMEDCRKRLYELRAELSTDKKDIVAKWLQEAQDEINKAVEIQKKVYYQTRPLYLQQFNDNKRAIDIKVEQLKETRKLYFERYDAVHKKLCLIGGDGINPYAAYALIAIGGSVAAAAGYFFSIFTFIAEFGNQDIIYFLLHGFIRSSNEGTMHFVFKALSILAGLTLITMVSFGCYWAIKRMNDNKNNRKREETSHYLQARFKYEGLQYFGQVKTRNWFILWLQILPIVLIVGLVILVLSLNGSAGKEINALNASNEGLLVGTALALGLGGMLYLYITKVIETRLAHKPSNVSGIWNWLKYNWELSLCILFFILCSGSIIYFHLFEEVATPGATLSKSDKIIITTLEFVATCFLSAFPFAYGLRLRGLMSLGRYLEHQISEIDDEIALYSVPFMSAVHVNYSEKLQDIVNDVLSVVQNKVYLFRGASSTRPAVAKMMEHTRRRRDSRNLLNDFLQSLRDIFNRSDQHDASFQRLSQLADWEAKYFPDHDERMKIISGEYKDKEKELYEVNKKIDHLEAHENNNKQLAAKEVEELYNKIDTLSRFLLKKKREKDRVLKKIADIAMEEETNIIDGFNLGMWCRENQLGPGEQYFTLCSNLKTNGHAINAVKQ